MALMTHEMIVGREFRKVEFIRKAIPYPDGFVDRVKIYLECVGNTAIEPTGYSTPGAPILRVPPLPRVGVFREKMENIALVSKRGSEVEMVVDEIDPKAVIGDTVIVYQSIRVT